MKKLLLSYLDKCGFTNPSPVFYGEPFTYTDGYVFDDRIDLNISLEDTFITVRRPRKYLLVEVYMYHHSSPGLGVSSILVENGKRTFKTVEEFSKWCDQRILEGTFMDKKSQDATNKKWKLTLKHIYRQNQAWVYIPN